MHYPFALPGATTGSIRRYAFLTFRISIFERMDVDQGISGWGLSGGNTPPLFYGRTIPAHTTPDMVHCHPHALPRRMNMPHSRRSRLTNIATAGMDERYGVCGCGWARQLCATRTGEQAPSCINVTSEAAGGRLALCHPFPYATCACYAPSSFSTSTARRRLYGAQNFRTLFKHDVRAGAMGRAVVQDVFVSPPYHSSTGLTSRADASLDARWDVGTPGPLVNMDSHNEPCFSRAGGVLDKGE